MENYFVIIDESGRLHDPNDRFLVFAAVVTETLVNLDKIIPQVKKTLPKKTKLAEIKFSTTGDKTRRKVLEKTKNRGLTIFYLVVDKEGRKIKDTPENYALLVSALLQKIHKYFPSAKHIIIDRHFTFVTQREKFNELLQKLAGKDLFVEHLDSQQNSIVSLPDFVAGAIRVGYSKNEGTYAGIIEPLVKDHISTTWKELGKQKGKSLKES